MGLERKPGISINCMKDNIRHDFTKLANVCTLTAALQELTKERVDPTKSLSVSQSGHPAWLDQSIQHQHRMH